MKNIEIIDFNEWFPYDGFAEGSGRSEKIWLQSPCGEIGLFKFPKTDPSTLVDTTEHISEHIAHQIGNIIGIETARIDIGTYHGRIGCMSYLLNEQKEQIIEGALFISQIHPDYDMEQMVEKVSGRYYCIDHLLEVSEAPVIVNKWIEMMLFDFIIGNTDRHQNNWAMLIHFEHSSIGNSAQIRVCPLYDNGSSLCCYINENNVDSYLGRDTNRFKSLTETKSRSMIRIDGFRKKHPTHIDVVKELLRRYPGTYDIAKRFVFYLNADAINTLMNRYVGILSDKKLQLITKYLKRKIEILENLING